MHRQVKLSVIVIVIFLTLLSWVGLTDRVSSEYTHQSILQAGAAYGISRGINAAVSVAQTSTIQFSLGVGGSITVGEILDPVNDLIERFSQVMTFALASLVLQKILIGIAASPFFNLICTLSAGGVILVLATRRFDWLNVSVRTFVILITLRLSLSIVLIFNSAIDQFFLEEQINHNQQQMASLKSDLKQFGEQTKKTPEEQPWYKKLPDLNMDIDMGFDIEKLQNKLTAGIDNIINLLTLFILKTVLLPIGFLYLLLRILRMAYTTDWLTQLTGRNNPMVSNKPDEAL